jgi:cytochrome c nitrite reductase small subunit
MGEGGPKSLPIEADTADDIFGSAITAQTLASTGSYNCGFISEAIDMNKALAAVISALLGIALGLGTYTFQFAKGFAYLSNDPKHCANCHIMQEHLDSWQKSSHHGRAVCNDCHTPHSLIPKLITKADNGWTHSMKFTLQTFGDPIRIRPVNAEKLQENCLRCHQDFVADVRAAGPHGGGDIRCVRCHASVGHGPRR